MKIAVMYPEGEAIKHVMFECDSYEVLEYVGTSSELLIKRDGKTIKKFNEWFHAWTT